MFKLGCAEAEFKVPLFVELYGYGPYAGRKNIGTFEPLYCRAYSFNDGNNRAMILYSDICCIDDLYARELRAKIATELHLNPESVAFVATHTHSGPAIGSSVQESVGIPNAALQDTWKRLMFETAVKAFYDEEEIASADAGSAIPDQPLGKNRVEPETNITDPAIRYMRFKRADGSVKLMIHNYAGHGISDSGKLTKYVSSDWMGKINRFIKEEKLADFPLYLQGAAGDQNVCFSCYLSGDPESSRKLADEYISCLKRDIPNAAEAKLDGISFILKTVEFPTIKQTAEELRQDEASFRSKGETPQEKEYWGVIADRLAEMAIKLEQGENLDSLHDLQIIRIGDAEFIFIPGELFIGPGIEMLNGADGKYPFLSTLSNGNGSYLFDENCAKKYPSIFSKNLGWGFYEIYTYMYRHKFKYRDDIAQFLIDNIRKLEKYTWN